MRTSSFDPDIIVTIEGLKIEAQSLMKLDVLDDDRFLAFKNGCILIYHTLLSQEVSSTVSELCRSGLLLEVREVRNFILKLLVSFVNSRPAYSFNAPFLAKHSHSDNLKTYVFNTEFKLNGLLFNLNKHLE